MQFNYSYLKILKLKIHLLFLVMPFCTHVSWWQDFTTLAIRDFFSLFHFQRKIPSFYRWFLGNHGVAKEKLPFQKMVSPKNLWIRPCIRTTEFCQFIWYVCKIFQKTNISYSMIRTHRNVSSSENFAYVLNEWSQMKKVSIAQIW